MKVLFCVDSLGLGGKERQAVELIKGLARRTDIELLVVCMDRDKFYEPDVRAVTLQLRHVIRRYRWDPFVFTSVREIIDDFRPDVIHTNGLLTSFYALPIGKWRGIPVINGSIRNAFDRPNLKWRLERALLTWSDIRVANSAAGLRSRGFEITSGQDFVIYNGIDLSRLPTEKAPRRPRSRAVVGMVAEFNKNKDYATFISAALRLLSSRQDVSFLAVGDGDALLKTKRLVPSSCNDITFLGRRKDVEHIVSGLSVGVLSTFTEGISNSVMEYMALGKPVIATGVGGCPEIVLDGRTGFLVPPSDPDSLADRIAYLLDRPDIARNMGDAGRRRIEELFSLDLMIEQTVRIYRQSAGILPSAPSTEATSSCACQATPCRGD